MIIISQETIKPSSPTPCHLKTHNLSVVDELNPPVHVPWIFFYKNYTKGDVNILKKSLSRCLTHYYPFAGRLVATSRPQHVDCNDQGVEFLEASIDGRLDDFISKKEQDETLNQLIPNSLGCDVNKTVSTSMVEVQLNYFTCGGAALGVSISHKLADGFTMVNFVHSWATLARGETPVMLSFSSSSGFSSSTNISNDTSSTTESTPEWPLGGKAKHITSRFVFSNAKLNQLKNNINVMATDPDLPPLNPTRVESLTCLLFKCAVGAATTKSAVGVQQSNCLTQAVNLRGGTKFPKLGAGNIAGMVMAKIAAGNKIKLDEVITSLRKGRMELQGVRDMEEVGKKLENVILSIGGNQSRTYNSSSHCRFPVYQVDFGWGNPELAMIRFANYEGSYIFLMDAPCGDGIEVTVHLEEEEMGIFQQDKELLAYTTQV